jgi:hypothetical protein
MMISNLRVNRCPCFLSVFCLACSFGYHVTHNVILLNLVFLSSSYSARELYFFPNLSFVYLNHNLSSCTVFWILLSDWTSVCCLFILVQKGGLVLTSPLLTELHFKFCSSFCKFQDRIQTEQKVRHFPDLRIVDRIKMRVGHPIYLTRFLYTYANNNNNNNNNIVLTVDVYLEDS